MSNKGDAVKHPDHDALQQVLHSLPTQPHAAFEILYQQYYKMMFGVAYSVLKNETQSQDAVQNVMLKLYQLPPAQLPTRGALCWLYRVTRNEALQLRRGEKYAPSLDDIAALPVLDPALEQLVDEDACRSLLKALDEQSRDIIAMKVIAGMTHREIAHVLQLPTGTVQWKYHKSIHRLQLLGANAMLFLLSLLGAVACQRILGDGVATAARMLTPYPSYLPALRLLFLTLLPCFGLSTLFFLKNFFKRPTN